MARLKTVLQWLLRRALLYLALVLAFAAAPFVAQAWKQAGELESAYRDLAQSEARLRGEYAGLERQFALATTGLESSSLAELDHRIAATRRQRDAEQRGLRQNSGIFALYREGPGALLVNEQRKLRIAVLERQLRSLEAARHLVDRRAAQAAQSVARDRLGRAQRDCEEATLRQRELEARWAYRLRSWIESAEHREIATRRANACEERDRARSTLADIAYLEGSTDRAQEALDASRRDLTRSLDEALAALSREKAEAETRWKGTYVQKLKLLAQELHLESLLVKAFWALLLILAAPFLVRVLFWTVFAPLAERRPAIRLRVPGGRGLAIAPSERSAPSVPVRLGPGDELLVRQSYLQTTSQAGAKATRWLLDWRHPLASFVSGLTFLTRIRGEGEVTTVSAVRDPFSEVTSLVIPEGTSCVLQPRALAAVVQPIDRPLRITAHWRLGSLNAWLTMQLRFLVFHGPCRLVVKGGRGVRVERAERGRIFGQAQLVGFSADLAYSVSRTETFWPYFFGYEQLFKDKVEAGEGVLVIEEAPMAGRRGTTRHGLEGAFDVMTKAFGI